MPRKPAGNAICPSSRDSIWITPNPVATQLLNSRFLRDSTLFRRTIDHAEWIGNASGIIVPEHGREIFACKRNSIIVQDL